MRNLFIIVLVLFLPQVSSADGFLKPLAGEKHFRNVKQLTFVGDNAEAYFSGDGKELIFQSTRLPFQCDQIFTMNADGSGEPRLVSTGKGRTTCSYFYPAGNKILFSSTHEASADCPPRPSFEQGYVWPLYAGYKIYVANRDGSDLKTLFDSPGYDAEATISLDGSKIVFTSTRDGDIDLYTMNADGSNVTRVTSEIGYDGGAFFSYDGTKIVYRAYHPTKTEELADYQSLLRQNLVRPSVMELFVMDADGNNKKQITNNDAANFAPFFHPSGKKIIFASNMHDPQGRDFDLFLINTDGTGLERVTYNDTFDAFPMFNADGTKLVWGSNRNSSEHGQTNVFIAEWVE